MPVNPAAGLTSGLLDSFFIGTFSTRISKCGGLEPGLAYADSACHLRRDALVRPRPGLIWLPFNLYPILKKEQVGFRPLDKNDSSKGWPICQAKRQAFLERRQGMLFA